MPDNDNGFGNKANSRSFLLRLYRVQADFETRRGGSGTVRVLDFITLRDPDRKVPFKIVDDATPQRDTNFGSTGRNPGRPDDSDFVEISAPGLREDAGGPALTSR